MSIASASIVIAVLRLLGFVAIVLLFVKYPWVLALQYTLLFVASLLGLYAIHRALEIEAPAFVTNAVNAVIARLPRPAAAAAT